MTYFVGIDIAKFEHVASILDSSTGELIVNSLHFDNNLKGFNLLLSKISMLNKEDVVIGFESCMINTYLVIRKFIFLSNLW